MHPDRRPVRPREPSEQVVERAVLLDQEDDVLDREPRRCRRRLGAGSADRSEGLGVRSPIVGVAAVHAHAKASAVRITPDKRPRDRGRRVIWHRVR
jgi:hypothetical protein